ncbi:response regulator [Candidatus Saccharibacteria bacterium]|nr:response regulator [Candidatus Saccharibacteria bacterium]MBQ6605707.1 response regulator [Candidatus Saccharibacteria bacterium]
MRKLIYIIDDDELMAECVSRVLSVVKNTTTKIFHHIPEAMSALDSEPLPDLIFLDVLLPGFDGFSFLNEIATYPDTMKIPIILISSLDFKEKDLKIYGVKGILKKEEMTPKEIISYVKRYTN